MSTIQELRQEAYRVAHETQQGGNTAPRIGNLYDGIIDFIDVLNQRTEDPYYYDDTELRNAIRRVDSAIAELDRALQAALAIANQERQRLDELINTIDDEIQDKVDTMLNDAEWLQDHARGIQQMVNEGEIYWKSEWDQSIEAYLQEVGVWAREGDVVKTQWTSITQDVASIESRVVEVQQDLAGRPTSTQWSQITQKVNSLEQSVNALYYQPDSVEALQSSITQSIDDKVASLKLETTYARLEDMGDAKEIVEWMYSAFRNQTSKDESFADIVSAGQSGFNNAISNLHTWVRAFENKDFLQYEAGASIEAKVNDAITGLYSKATPEQATTTLFSQVKKDTQDIAAIIVNATGDSSEVDIATKFARWKAGLVVQSDLAGARASLLATMDEKDAASALVLEQTISESSASLLAIMNGKVAGLVTKADFDGAMAQVVAKSDYNAASITAMINNSGSEIKLNADKINFTFTQATNFISGDKTVMSLDGQGNLSLTGEITATKGSITGDMTIGSGTKKMIIVPSNDGAKIIGKSGDTEVLSLGFYDTTSSHNPQLRIGSSHIGAESAQFRGYPNGRLGTVDIEADGLGGSSIHTYYYGSDGVVNLTLGSFDKFVVIRAYDYGGEHHMWPTSINQVKVGGVYVESDGIMRVRLS